jgi:putative transposase
VLNKYTRVSMPTAHRDLTTWPLLDFQALPERPREVAIRRHRAIRAYIGGHELEAIKADTGIAKTSLMSTFRRCLEIHPDGRIFGWRALTPYEHVKPYSRTARLAGNNEGYSGAFTLFLTDHPYICEKIRAVIREGKGGDAVAESRFAHRKVYGHFRRLCVAAGIAETHYPFTNKDGGRRALREYALTVLRSDWATDAHRLGGNDARVHARIGQGIAPAFSSALPYDLVTIDSHQLNFVGCIAVPRGARHEIVPIHRMHLMPVVDERSGAVLGYDVAIGKQPSTDHVVRAIKSALSRWQPKTGPLDLKYPEAAMMPSAISPELCGVCWNAIRLDNAAIHLSTTVIEDVRKRCGCALNFGPPGAWYRRAIGESVHSALERAGFTRLPNSTGFGPADPKRPDSNANAVKYRMTFDELLQLVDIKICEYNASPRPTLGGLSPLEVLANAALCAPTLWLPRKLPAEPPPGVPELGTKILELVVRGRRETGKRPYVQYASVHYASPLLSREYDLIGKSIRVHVHQEDLRVMKAYLADGKEIGLLKAAEGWDRTQHDLILRKQILKAIGEKSLVLAPGDDAVQAYLVALARRALKSLDDRGSRRPIITPDATSLARATHVSGTTVPTVPGNVTPIKRPPSSFVLPDKLPAFVPSLRHRGTTK